MRRRIRSATGGDAGTSPCDSTGNLRKSASGLTLPGTDKRLALARTACYPLFDGNGNVTKHRRGTGAGADDPTGSPEGSEPRVGGGGQHRRGTGAGADDPTGSPEGSEPRVGGGGQYLNSSGAVVPHYRYDPFGRTLYQTGTHVGNFKFRFSTKRIDPETGCYYYGYRLYNSCIGSWLNRDPTGLIDDIGVETSNGPAGSGYELEATTAESHPLIGKRRWGSMPVMTPAGECPTVSIWTEVYEVTNNSWNAWVSDPIEDSANTMWADYLNAIAAKVGSECGGGHGSAGPTVDDYSPLPGPNPWR